MRFGPESVGKHSTTLRSVSQHHYSGDSCETSHDDVEAFTSKANIRASLDGLRSDIQASLENEVEYVLGEAGSYTCHVGFTL